MQDEAQATYARKIKTSDAGIDWQRPATELQRLVRAYNPVPGAWFMLDEQRIKCWRAEIEPDVSAAPGSVIAASPDGITVACGEGGLRLLEVQRPGKRPVTAAQFVASVAGGAIAGRQL